MTIGATAELEQLSQETMTMLRKAATSGVLVSTGVQGVDLSGFTALVPVNVPARNNTSAFPRVTAGMGSQVALWRTWLNINSSQQSAAVGRDFAGSMTQFSEQDVYAPYQVVSKAGRVTLDAVAVARNYVDALAQAELQVLNQLFISQDDYIINAQAWSLGTPVAPTIATAITGGSIPTATAVYVRVAARSGVNYFEGGSTIASTPANVTTGAGSANTVTASIPAVRGAVAYDWYVGTVATQFYYTTTTAATVLITAVPTVAQAVPLAAPGLPLISALAPGLNVAPLAIPPTPGTGAPPTADTSFNSNYYNGLIASTLGDYGATGPVAPGSGNPSGATFIDFGGAALALAGGGVNVLDQINDRLWASVQLSATAYMINSLQADEISGAVLASGAATTFLPPTDADARTNLAGGGYVGRYINRAAGGVPVNIEVHPHVPPGTIIARTDRVPFPGSNIGTVFEVRNQYDTMRFDYAANWSPGTIGGGPRYDFEIRSMETLVEPGPGGPGHRL